MKADEKVSAGKSELRNSLESFILRSVRFYTSNTPIKRGRGRIFQAAHNLCANIPRRERILTKFGFPLVITYSKNVNDSTYFLGEYEPGLSAVVAAVLRPGDTCLDVGANFGWYSLLFSHIVGASGEVHAFEPVPATFRQLTENASLLGPDSKLQINNLALGEEEKEITINTFPALGHGYSSMSDLGRADAVPVVCQMTTFDEYRRSNLPDREVDFVKADIEGAELLFFQGAASLFTQSRPPIMMIEMSAELDRGFGYTPNDLLDLIESQAAYLFYKADEIKGTLIPFERFTRSEMANVFCFPKVGFEDRREALVGKFVKDV